jgi:hypothetical protein
MLDIDLILAKTFKRLEDLDPYYRFDLQVYHSGLFNKEDWDNISSFVKFWFIFINSHCGFLTHCM